MQEMILYRDAEMYFLAFLSLLIVPVWLDGRLTSLTEVKKFKTSVELGQIKVDIKERYI